MQTAKLALSSRSFPPANPLGQPFSSYDHASIPSFFASSMQTFMQLNQSSERYSVSSPPRACMKKPPMPSSFIVRICERSSFSSSLSFQLQKGIAPYSGERFLISFISFSIFYPCRNLHYSAQACSFRSKNTYTTLYLAFCENSIGM